MDRASLHSLSRILLVGSAVGLGATVLQAQDAPSTPPAQPASPGTPAAPDPTAPAATPAPAQSTDTSASAAPAAPQAAPKAAPVSRIDIFTGYSYYAPKATVTTNSLVTGQPFPLNYGSVDTGAIGSVAYFFNRYVGGVAEYANHSLGKNDGFQNLAAGIIGRYPTDLGVTPFVHGMAGAARVGGPNAEPDTYHNYTWGPLVKVGGGLDYDTPLFNHKLGIRLFQADFVYTHANFGPQAGTGGRANINAPELSAGVLYKLGNITPPPPVTLACTVNPTSVFPGDPVTVTGTAANLNPKKPATYTWNGQGLTVKGDNSNATVDTASLQPGTYTVNGHVTEGPKAGQSADCAPTFTVKQFEPPTISCSANPTSVEPGGSSTITSMGVSPQNRPLTYSYSATAGQISGTSNTATLSTAGAPSGAITVTCNVADDKGQTATTTTTVTVNTPPAPAPKVQTLCVLNFDRDTKRPARVDNEAKACLDDVALNLQRSADATATLVGNAGEQQAAPAKTRKGKKAAAAMTPEKLAAQRAVNAKDYLVKEKGVDASRISVRTGSKGANEVDDYLVPAGANFDSEIQGTTAVDESSVQAQSRTAPVAKHHRRKK